MRSAAAQWCSPPVTLSLGIDEVHVWRARLDQPASRVQGLLQTLSADEGARASRFHFQRDQERFIVAHGVLRIILAHYLNSEAYELEFLTDHHGKPLLKNRFGDDSPCFNMSHSQGLGLYAVARRHDVGIDIECIRPDLAEEIIADRFFSTRESAVLRALPPEIRRQAFFQCWTGKEAYLKARGVGLSAPLDHFDVSLIAREAEAPINVRGDSNEDSRWYIQALNASPGYVAALATEGRAGQLKYWQWPR